MMHIGGSYNNIYVKDLPSLGDKEESLCLILPNGVQLWCGISSGDFIVEVNGYDRIDSAILDTIKNGQIVRFTTLVNKENQ
jgi:hypothetical protein